jgi:hypothetical protein
MLLRRPWYYDAELLNWPVVMGAGVGAVVLAGKVLLLIAVVTPVFTVDCNTLLGSVTAWPFGVETVTPPALVPVCEPAGGGVMVSPISAPEVIVIAWVPPEGRVTVAVTLVTV